MTQGVLTGRSGDHFSPPGLSFPVNSLPTLQGCAGTKCLKAVGDRQLRISGVEGPEAGHDLGASHYSVVAA